MNKKEAVAYAQITLNFMMSSKYNGEINAETFGIEMRQAFKLYPRNIVFTIADAQIKAAEYVKKLKKGSDIDE